MHNTNHATISCTCARLGSFAWRTSLHTSTDVAIMIDQLSSCTGQAGGNPTSFASMVHFWARRGPQLSEQQQQHIINHVCQGAVLVDTEAAARQYRHAVTRHSRCPHLVCKDTGSLIRSNGSIRIGLGATAPRSIGELGVCLGAPSIEATDTYRRCQSVLSTLAQMPHLTQNLATARVNTSSWTNKQ